MRSGVNVLPLDKNDPSGLKVEVLKSALCRRRERESTRGEQRSEEMGVHLVIPRLLIIALRSLW